MYVALVIVVVAVGRRLLIKARSEGIVVNKLVSGDDYILLVENKGFTKKVKVTGVVYSCYNIGDYYINKKS